MSQLNTELFNACDSKKADRNIKNSLLNRELVLTGIIHEIMSQKFYVWQHSTVRLQHLLLLSLVQHSFCDSQGLNRLAAESTGCQQAAAAGLFCCCAAC